MRVTHLYVRFLPKDWSEYDQLQNDTTLKLYDIPLDHEVALHGNTYHDPSIPEDKPTWQYTAVKADFEFPSIEYQVLEQLYLPEQDSTLNQNSNSGRVSSSFVDQLVDQAMILTKNYADVAQPVSNSKAARWTPQGTVRVFDTRLNRLIPLVGVRMRARRWFDIRETFTNDNGYYQLASFERPANYALFFETNKFDIRGGLVGQAWIDGPKQSSPWNVDIWDGVNRFEAHVFRAAHRYFHGDVEGLTRPDFGAIKFKFSAMNSSGIA